MDIDKIFKQVSDSEEKVADIMRALKSIMNDFFSSPEGINFWDSENRTSQYDLEKIKPLNGDVITVNSKSESKNDSKNSFHVLAIDVGANGRIKISTFREKAEEILFKNTDETSTIVAKIISTILTQNNSNVYEAFISYTNRKKREAKTPCPPR